MGAITYFIDPSELTENVVEPVCELNGLRPAGFDECIQNRNHRLAHFRVGLQQWAKVRKDSIYNINNFANRQ